MAIGTMRVINERVLELDNKLSLCFMYLCQSIRQLKLVEIISQIEEVLHWLKG